HSGLTVFSLSRLRNGSVQPLDKILIFNLDQLRIRRIASPGQAVHAARGRIGPVQLLHTLAVGMEGPAMAGTQKELLLPFIIDGAAQVRANRREGVELIAGAAHEPDPANHIVGVKGPGVPADITDHNLAWLSER